VRSALNFGTDQSAVREIAWQISQQSGSCTREGSSTVPYPDMSVSTRCVRRTSPGPLKCALPGFPLRCGVLLAAWLSMLASIMNLAQDRCMVMRRSHWAGTAGCGTLLGKTGCELVSQIVLGVSVWVLKGREPCFLQFSNLDNGAIVSNRIWTWGAYPKLSAQGTAIRRISSPMVSIYSQNQR